MKHALTTYEKIKENAKKGCYLGTKRPTFVCVDPDCKGGIEYLMSYSGAQPKGYFSCRFCYALFEIKPELVKKHKLNVVHDWDKQIKNYDHSHKWRNQFIFKTLQEAKDKETELRTKFENVKSANKPRALQVTIAKEEFFKGRKGKVRAIYSYLTGKKLIHFHGDHFLYELRKDGTLKGWVEKKTPRENTVFEFPNKKPYKTEFKLWSNPSVNCGFDSLLELKTKINQNGLPIPHSKAIFQQVLPEQFWLKNNAEFSDLPKKIIKTPCCNEKFTKISFPTRAGYYRKKTPYSICSKCRKPYEIRVRKKRGRQSI